MVSTMALDAITSFTNLRLLRSASDLGHRLVWSSILTGVSLEALGGGRLIASV